MIRALVFACALGAVACKKKEPPPAQGPLPGTEGAWCDRPDQCIAPLQCLPASRRCGPADHPEVIAAREAELAAERRFLEQSGVEAAATAERPTGPPAEGAVRVVRVSTEGQRGTVFAACRGDERLVGGGCKLVSELVTFIDSYPSHQGDADTIGARWNCEGGGMIELEAYALCQRLTAPAASTTAP